MKFTWLSNAPWAPTGYGNQTKVFIPRLQALGHEAAIIAFYGHEGTPINWNGILIYGKGFHAYGGDVMSAHTRHYQGEVLFSLMDAWVVETGLLHKTRWIPWFPIDHEPLPQVIKEKVEKGYKRIVFSEFGCQMMDGAGLDYYYVPHGIDTNVFKPMDKRQAREDLKWRQDAFIFGMVAANKGNPSRKAYPQILTAFANFYKRHKSAMLYIHAHKTAEQQGLNIPELVEQLGITDAVMYCDQYINLLGYPDEYMVKMYNALDAHLLVSMGEGFGIPIVEAQACGTPVIVGDWTSMGELCFGGWKVPKEDADPWYTPLAAYQFVPRTDAIEAVMNEAYRDIAKIHSEKAREGALTYDADAVTHKYWKPVLEDIEKGLE